VAHTSEQRDHLSTPLCGAKKRNGETCRAFAGQGTDHKGVGRCKNHGGSTRTHKSNAIVVEAKRRMVKLGEPVPGIEPHEALLAVLRATAGHVAWLHREVAGLEDLASQESRVVVTLYDNEAGALAEQRTRRDKVRMARDEAVQELARIREERFQERHAVAQALNAALGPRIDVDVQQSGLWGGYAEAIAESIRGSGLHSDLAPEVAACLSPQELVAVVEQDDAQKLAACVNVPEDRARRVLVARRCPPACVSRGPRSGAVARSRSAPTRSSRVREGSARI
jgi:hypothetical protein